MDSPASTIPEKAAASSSRSFCTRTGDEGMAASAGAAGGSANTRTD